jgi:trk system potassium uptake protein TrkA
MKIVIVGYGRVGMRTTNVLTSEGHEVVIIEQDPEKAQRAREDGLETIEGDAEDQRVLDQAGLDDAAAFGALTADLNVNFTACMVANGHGCRTVLRIDEDYRQDIYEKYAADVDEVIYPERLGAAGAKTALLGGDLNVLADLTEHLTATTISIPDGSPVVGKRVVELDVPDGARLYGHGGASDPLTIPMPRTSIEVGDRVAVIAEQPALERMREMVAG